LAIITSDNPRTENPMDIINDIVAGIPEGVKNYTVIENRIDETIKLNDFKISSELNTLVKLLREASKEINLILDAIIKEHADYDNKLLI
jgi:hypothetical protein